MKDNPFASDRFLNMQVLTIPEILTLSQTLLMQPCKCCAGVGAHECEADDKRCFLSIAGYVFDDDLQRWVPQIRHFRHCQSCNLGVVWSPCWS